MSSVDDVWQSDELIPIDIKESLIARVSRLENVLESEKDWYPGTNKQILDLVHPSLFCFVNQVTRIINDKERIVNVDNALEHIGDDDFFWDDYTRSDTYQWLPVDFDISKDVIEQIYERFIPLFNKALTDLIHFRSKPHRILFDPYQSYDDSNLPDVEEFHMPSPTTKSIDLRGRKLQMIVKLANIIMTLDNFKYPGGVWHVEGMKNERIVATGIYYYSSSNITQADLQFRTLIKNRCIVFPNIYQHRVAPFQWKDPTQEDQPNVPPQQTPWFVNIIRSISPFNTLPLVVMDKIMDYIDFPMSMKQAKDHRNKLMDERKYFISRNNEFLFERSFSLCEH
ncbi:unnamed protein product [Rotaria sp. Silwood1]|nr:unnamed protein product [Rotaria sp. Silwood1]